MSRLCPLTKIAGKRRGATISLIFNGCRVFNGDSVGARKQTRGMNSIGFRVVALGAVVTLSACAFAEDLLSPSFTGEDPKAPPKAAAAAPATTPRPAADERAQAGPAMPAGQPPLGSTDFQPPTVTPGAPTGTDVGKKVVELRQGLTRLQASIIRHNIQLQQLRAKMVQDSQRYHGTVAAISARLQVGTTPGNPILVQQFNGAQTELDRLNADIGEMNRLANEVAADAALSGFLSESARAAFRLSGAIDEDHRQLAILEDEVNRLVVLIDRLLNEVADDVRRQTSYVSTERGNLNLLAAGVKAGEIYGASLVNRAMMAAAGGRQTSAAPGGTAGRRPLIVIRFDRPDVPYQQALYNAISRVLERRPNARFELVSVAPSGGGTARAALNATKARRLAEGVMRALVEMGLPPSRVTFSAMTSDTAKTNEAHVYLR